MKRSYWFLIFLLWQVIGLVATVMMSLTSGDFHHFVHNLILCLTFTNFIGIGIALIIVLHEKILKHLDRRKLVITAEVVACAVVIVLGTDLAMNIGRMVCGIDHFEVDRWHLLTIIVNFIIFASSTVFFILIMLHNRLAANLERKIRENEKLNRLQLEAKFALLQSKVNPHFLFNTLNTMLEVLKREPAQVEKMILNLSDIYRKTLTISDTRLVSLHQELELVREYLEIEKIRMGQRLDYNLIVSDDLMDTKIPPMMLQILVENAVKHGISPKKHGGEVGLTVELIEDRIVVNVQDTGVGIQEKDLYSGYGLSSIRQRLKMLYDTAADLVVSQLPQGGTKVVIQMPYEA